MLRPELKGDRMRYSKNSLRGAMAAAIISIGLHGMSACPSWLLFASSAAADIDSVAPPSVNPFQADFSNGSDGTARALRKAKKGARASRKAKKTVSALRAALKDQNAAVRSAAAEALRKIGP